MSEKRVVTFEGKKSVIPFGPQHPVLPEPIHLDLVLEDEKVIDAIPSVGYIHRGLEGLVSKKKYDDYVYVVERTCGICSFMHGMSYCECIEHIMNVDVPPRAKYLRTIWCEMSRLHSHLMWLGLLADAFGFESLFMQSWRLREKILDMFEMSTGGRVIFSVNTIGGVLKDMPKDMLDTFVKKFDEMDKELRTATAAFLDDYSVATRVKGVGILTKDEAHDLGAVGPMLRGSGVKADMRQRGYAAYNEIDFDIPTATEGDCYARMKVRIEEIFASIDIIRKAVKQIPDGEIATPKPKVNPNGEYFMRVEQPRGEAVYFVKANGTPFLDRMRIRTPTFANVPALVQILKGVQLSDVPIVVLTIDPCISCIER